ncbi:MAG: transposase [Flavobacteriales bacterium]|nr:transposase [Flavobacteriales bacterium]
MANTYRSVLLQYVFAVKGRHNLLHKSWRDEVFRYMTGIIEAKGQKSIIVNGVSDHVHVLVGVKPPFEMDAFIRDVKNNSSKFINKKGWLPRKFSWQSGYGIFSYSQDQIHRLYEYILNQEAHHAKKSFKEEYIQLLKDFEIEYEEKYLFEWYE